MIFFFLGKKGRKGTLKDTKLDMIFFFLGKKGRKGTLKAPNTMLKSTIGAKKCVGDVAGVYMVEDIVYFICYSNHKGCQGPLGNTIGKMLWDVGKVPKKFFWGNERYQKIHQEL
jgi:hypothetical protein